MDMVAIVNYNFILPEDLCDLHSGHLHNGHGSDRELQFSNGGKHI